MHTQDGQSSLPFLTSIQRMQAWKAPLTVATPLTPSSVAHLPKECPQQVGMRNPIEWGRNSIAAGLSLPSYGQLEASLELSP